ncbi:MAG: retroviral-like aspartic protease family protein [Pseudomonadales bacterium]
MRNFAFRSAAGVISLASALTLLAPWASADTLIPLKPHNKLDTFYIDIGVAGGRDEEYLVDTGAGYMTITKETLVRSQQAGTATYLRDLDGRMADGSMLRVELYRLSHITIGNSCTLHDVEVAVLPGASRGLLGLSALRRTSPFEFSVDPPTLRLSNCTSNALAAE